MALSHTCFLEVGVHEELAALSDVSIDGRARGPADGIRVISVGVATGADGTV